MTVQYIVERRLKKISNWFIARKIKGTNKVNFPLFPYLRGLSYVKIGTNFSAGPGLRLEVSEDYKNREFKVEIGNNVVINDYVHIGCANRITIGNNVLIASKVYITDHNHGYYDAAHLDKHESPEIPPLKRKLTEDGFVEIEDCVWIGEFVTILPYSKIGKGSIIGANSVVLGEIPPYSIAVGSPARVIKKYDLQKKQWLRIQTMAGSSEDMPTPAEPGTAWSQAPLEKGNHHRSFVNEDLMSRTKDSEAMNARHSYFAHTRKEIQQLLPDEVSRALEIGCGTGSTLLWLKGLKHCTWIGGVEVVPEALTEARNNLDAVYEGNIEQMDLPIEEGTLDLVLCLDVLEHLVDPWHVVNRLKSLLKVGGSIIVSIPNIRNHKVLSLLLFRGKWDYTDAGILDRGHLRFFVHDTAIKLIESSGLKVDLVMATGLGRSRRSRIVNALFPSLITSLFVKQYLIRGIRVD